MSRPTEFGALVKACLYERGLTQAWLAQAVGVEPASLSRAMRGGRKPSAELVLAISSAMGLSGDREQELLAAGGYPRPGARRRPAASSSAQAVRRSPLSFPLGSDDEPTEPASAADEIGHLLSGLPNENRDLAARLILQTARAICETLQGASSEGATNG